MIDLVDLGQNVNMMDIWYSQSIKTKIGHLIISILSSYLIHSHWYQSPN